MKNLLAHERPDALKNSPKMEKYRLTIPTQHQEWRYYDPQMQVVIYMWLLRITSSMLFKIDIQSRIATYISEIKKLLSGFTTNGAVVEAQGKIIFNSANSMTGYYKR